MCFRARLHQRSLAPVWNDFWWLWWPMISGDVWDLSLPDICLTVEEKPRKNLNQENWSDRGSNPGPLGERQRCYPSTTAVGNVKLRIINLNMHLFRTYLFLLGQTENKKKVALIMGCRKEPLWRMSISSLYRSPELSNTPQHDLLQSDTTFLYLFNLLPKSPLLMYRPSNPYRVHACSKVRNIKRKTLKTSIRLKLLYCMYKTGVKGEWDIRFFDLVKNLKELIFNYVVNFCDVRMA